MTASNAIDPRLRSWQAMSLKYKLRKHGQRDAYDFIRKWKENNPHSGGPVTINAHRRWGKSFLSILLGVERAISAPKQRVRVVSPTKIQGMAVFSEQWAEIMKDCPDTIEIRNSGPEEIRVFNSAWKNADPQFDYSSMWVHGSEAGGGERLRGQGSDMIILDECRDMTDLEYLMKNVLGWHTIKRKNPLMVIISTPPRTADHYLTAVIIPKAKEEKRYFQVPISEDKDITPEEYQYVLELCGTKESVAWQREGECQLLADPGALVLYEWQRMENYYALKELKNPCLIDKDYQRPEYYWPRTTIDAGFGDRNGIVFWYWDFQEKKMVVLDEIFTRGMNSQQLKDLVLVKEKEIFGGAKLFADLRRDGDMTPQQRADMWDLFRFRVLPLREHDKMAAIDALNAGIACEKVLVSKTCIELIHQLRNAAFIRDGSQRFVRTERMGHCDMVASLIQAYRDIERLDKWDPFPTQGVYIGEQFVPNNEEAESDLALISERTYEL
jgi:hypothetical protein